MRTIALTAFLFAACDSDDGPSPADHCRDFLDLICTRSISCGETTTDHRTCVATSEARLTSGRGCGITIGLRDQREFDSCMAQIESASCADLLSAGAPPECEGQLLLPE